MWNHAEVAGLLDADGRVALVSRNEEEAPVKEVLGKRAVDLIHPECVPTFERSFANVLKGKTTCDMMSAIADAGYRYWFKVCMLPSPAPDAPVLFHFRRLPRTWNCMSQREREVVEALHHANMNPKRAARELGMSVHTLNAHRRSICKKCGLQGIGDFWVFVERCR
jgi:DNA-binding CsgD family transcriptional regulator